MSLEDVISSATHILVAAGAGLSTNAGVDYFDRVKFAARYPGMVKMGYEYPYQLVGNPDLLENPALFWGYLSGHVYHTRFHEPEPGNVYELIMEYLAATKKDYFVCTTNVDGLFERSGFSTDKLWTMQGDFSRLQCIKPCKSSSVFDSYDILEAIRAKTDPSTQLLTDLALIPKCPNCKGDTMLNVNAGRFFSRYPFEAQNERFVQWLDVVRLSRTTSKMVILELGVGFNTPSVIRWPMEGLARQCDNICLVRVNLEHAGFSRESAIPSQRYFGLEMDTLTFVKEYLSV